MYTRMNKFFPAFHYKCEACSYGVIVALFFEVVAFKNISDRHSFMWIYSKFCLYGPVASTVLNCNVRMQKGDCSKHGLLVWAITKPKVMCTRMSCVCWPNIVSTQGSEEQDAGLSHVKRICSVEFANLRNFEIIYIHTVWYKDTSLK